MIQKTNNIKLTLTYNEFISVNHYMNYRTQGKIVMAYKPLKTKNFERNLSKYIKEELNKQGWIKPNKNKFIIMDTTFYFPRVDMDAQNYFKSLCDVMTSVNVWEDDNKVMERVNRVYYDNKNPRIEIEVYESDFIGIFDNEEEYLSFKSICDACKKFKGGKCSIYKKTLESRIQDDVIRNDFWKCLKYKK